MKQLIKRLLISTAILLNAAIAFAYDFEVDGIYYNIVDMENLTCEVTDDDDNPYTTEKLVIPETVTYNGRQLTVVGVGDSGLNYGEHTSVTLPHTITYLGGYIFSSKMEELILLDSEDVLNYDEYTFSNSKIKTLYWGRNMIANDYRSVDLKDLTSLTIGKYITEFNCDGPISESYAENIKTMVISDAESELVMDYGEFPNLKTVYIGRNLSYDGYKYSLFSDQLTSASIGNLVTVIPYGIFNGCSGLTSIIIPNSVTTIDGTAFKNCSGLISVSIPNSVSVIGNSAFSGCSGLTSVSIPNSVTTIGDMSFENCSGLTSITIPNSVTEIGWQAFNGCRSLTHLTIGNSVNAIAIGAFANCNNLTVINSLNLTPPSCDPNYMPFDNKTFINATLYVPEGTLAAYQEADGWKNFWNIKEGFEPSGVAVHTTDTNVSVTTNYGTIEVAGVDNGAIIDVYNVDGQLVYSGTDTTINVPTKGIYIVRVAGQTFKVAL